MPSQDSIDIASIFDDIEEHNLKYCCICFRTEEERKLVYGDTHFLKCLKFMDVWTAAAPFPYIGDTAGLQTPAAVSFFSLTHCFIFSPQCLQSLLI